MKTLLGIVGVIVITVTVIWVRHTIPAKEKTGAELAQEYIKRDNEQLDKAIADSIKIFGGKDSTANWRLLTNRDISQIIEMMLTAASDKTAFDNMGNQIKEVSGRVMSYPSKQLEDVKTGVKMYCNFIHYFRTDADNYLGRIMKDSVFTMSDNTMNYYASLMSDYNIKSASEYVTVIEKLGEKINHSPKTVLQYRTKMHDSFMNNMQTCTLLYYMIFKENWN